jgi:hypothetical protein
MPVIRFTNSSTSDNRDVLLNVIRDPHCKRVRLFASGDPFSPAFRCASGPDTNVPLVSALATYDICGIDEVTILFDGLFLTAARPPRLGEVQAVLDAAQASAKAEFCSVMAPLTANLEPDAAAELLFALGPVEPLTAESRALYFLVLSPVATEEAYAA